MIMFSKPTMQEVTRTYYGD